MNTIFAVGFRSSVTIQSFGIGWLFSHTASPCEDDRAAQICLLQPLHCLMKSKSLVCFCHLVAYTSAFPPRIECGQYFENTFFRRDCHVNHLLRTYCNRNLHCRQQVFKLYFQYLIAKMKVSLFLQYTVSLYSLPHQSASAGYLKAISFVLISILIALCNFAAEIFIFVSKHSNYTFNPCLQK